MTYDYEYDWSNAIATSKSKWIWQEYYKIIAFIVIQLILTKMQLLKYWKNVVVN